MADAAEDGVAATSNVAEEVAGDAGNETKAGDSNEGEVSGAGEEGDAVNGADGEADETKEEAGDEEAGDEEAGEDVEREPAAPQWPFTTVKLFEKPEDGTASPEWQYRGPRAEGIAKGWIIEEKVPEPEPLDTRFYAAFYEQDIEAMQELVAESLEGVQQVVKDRCLLHQSCLLGAQNVLQFLLTNTEPDLLQVDAKQRSLLHCALDSSKDVRGQIVMEVLQALRARNEDQVHVVINSRDARLRSCVDIAAQDSGRGMLLHKLLYLKGDVNLPTNDGRLKGQRSPLILASMAGIDDNVKALCEAKAEVNYECKDDSNLTSTPLIYACMEGHFKVAKILLKAGADYTMKDLGNNSTPRQWAALMGNTACENLLASIEQEAAHQQELEEHSITDPQVDPNIPLSTQAAKLNAEFDSPAALELRKRTLKAQNEAYCNSSQNNFKPLLQCFLRHVLKDQPNNVMQYAARFFTQTDLAETVRNSTPSNP